MPIIRDRPEHFLSLSLTHSRKRNRSLERERACTGILSTWKVKCAAASARMMMMMICRNVFYSRRIPVSSSDLVFLLQPHSPHFYIIYIHASGTDLLRSVAINFHSSVLSLSLIAALYPYQNEMTSRRRRCSGCRAYIHARASSSSTLFHARRTYKWNRDSCPVSLGQ